MFSFPGLSLSRSLVILLLRRRRGDPKPAFDKVWRLVNDARRTRPPRLHDFLPVERRLVAPCLVQPLCQRLQSLAVHGSSLWRAKEFQVPLLLRWACSAGSFWLSVSEFACVSSSLAISFWWPLGMFGILDSHLDV